MPVLDHDFALGLWISTPVALQCFLKYALSISFVAFDARIEARERAAHACFFA